MGVLLLTIPLEMSFASRTDLFPQYRLLITFSRATFDRKTVDRGVYVKNDGVVISFLAANWMAPTEPRVACVVLGRFSCAVGYWCPWRRREGTAHLDRKERNVRIGDACGTGERLIRESYSGSGSPGRESGKSRELNYPQFTRRRI
jgi:hypothetical protein